MQALLKVDSHGLTVRLAAEALRPESRGRGALRRRRDGQAQKRVHEAGGCDGDYQNLLVTAC